VLATCPSLPEVTTFGEDDIDALAHAVDAIEEALAARIADGEDIAPPPERSRGRSVALPLMTSLKASLYRTLRESGITRAELMRRLGWNRESIDRLFRLGPRLAPPSDRGGLQGARQIGGAGSRRSRALSGAAQSLPTYQAARRSRWYRHRHPILRESGLPNPFRQARKRDGRLFCGSILERFLDGFVRSPHRNNSANRGGPMSAFLARLSAATGAFRKLALPFRRPRHA